MSRANAYTAFFPTNTGGGGAKHVTTGPDARHERERQFHNEVFAAGGRQTVHKYYTATAPAQERFRSLAAKGAAEATVLEYGCGQGSAAFALAPRAARLTGVDLSDVAIAQAKQRAKEQDLPNTAFLVMNAEALAFPADSFDLVVGIAILHHLDLRKAYGELARVLRPSGRAVFLEPLGHNPLINWYRDRTPGLRTPDERPLRMDDIRLASAYFRRVHASYFTLLSLAAVPFRNLPGFSVLARLLHGADQALFTLVPPLRRHAWITVLELDAPLAPAVE